MKLRSRDFGDHDQTHRRRMGNRPSMKLRSRDFGDQCCIIDILRFNDALNEAPKPRLRRFLRCGHGHLRAHPSMKLRSRDFGDGHELVGASEDVGDPSMKLRSRDFGDAAIHIVPQIFLIPSMKLRSRDFGDFRVLVRERTNPPKPSMKLRSRDFGDGASRSRAVHGYAALNEAPKPRLRRWSCRRISPAWVWTLNEAPKPRLRRCSR
ncbi:hypothetical protein PG2054B_1320 [Bifidobacterium pseudolongum subsp. pseudolongum]|uniref:Uncharacterized protein n=1 Tax=Bifidobacterium pseudolongum subsp. pseudolongum TaxID=31954 RepID=A0A4Q5A812_9BIFI|nr:hypothetical protein PG2054B_1320 [Bifidobacterium pseudolongum subsp. pseudolongum]